MSAQDTLRENFAAWHREIALIHELALAQAGTMANMIEGEEGEGTPRIGHLRAVLQEILGKNAANCPLINLAHATERLAFLDAFLASHKALTLEVEQLLGEGEGEPRAPLAAPVIAAMHAPLTERAKDTLAALFPDATLLYCNGFLEVCERLSHGEAALALLPLEDSTEGVLYRVLDLAERFELHIAATLSVKTSEGSEARLALFYHGRAPLLTAVGEDMLECDLFETGETVFGATLGSLLLVAGACGLSLRRVDTRTVSGNLYHHPVFFATGARLTLFAAYLALFMPRTVITAHYIHLTKESELPS